ncbi:hypothetical protein KEH51_11700 [[Brevibacterium] frigoritolerans]|uniref:Uncharacterized protein n=1 Tax=Peribacillus frigoritolerans TaxID=450367 RepID=A0A941FNM0_9BACI|nr:hypothetical protein [Peribacillus frigoritolerans]
MNQAKSLVDQQANDLQRILNSIDDILPLDMFNQKDFNEKSRWPDTGWMTP